MKIINCPDNYIRKGNGEVTLFVAGGITGCDDWQTPYMEMLKDTELTLFNPRRSNFDITDPHASVEQIEWEYEHLLYANITSFWFPKETLCPITLLELGKKMVLIRPIAVGCDPDYARKLDLHKQLELERPGVKLVHSLTDLAEEVRGIETRMRT